jgi:dTDP-4-amino-4,6-dideoxygalactose transaminase
VITVPNVFIAAVEVIARLGAKPVLVDVRQDTYCIDPESVEAAVTPRTKAIVPVHLFGLPADMDALLDIAARHSIFVIEDACQAHGATYNGKRVGSLGHAAAFSFYPTKNLSGLGDGGAVTTNDPDVAKKVRMLRHHAQVERNTHAEIGYNCRLDSLQAAVLNIKLSHLDRWNEQRRALAERYRSRLEGTGYGLQSVPPGTVPVYHIVAVRHRHRELVHEQLDQHRIGWGKHIAMPIHEQPGYRFLGYNKGDFPVSELLCDELVSLPIFPALSEAEVDYVTDALAKVVVPV